MKQRGFLTEKAIVWLVAIAACLALWGAAVHAYHVAKDTYDGNRREEGRVEIRGLWKSAVDADTKRLEEERQAKDAQQKENDHVEALARSRVADDLARARAAGNGLQQRVDQLLAARRDPAQGAGTAGQRQGEQDPAAGAVLSDVFSRVRGAAGDLGAYADALYTAGQRCERGYDTEVKP